MIERLVVPPPPTDERANSAHQRMVEEEYGGDLPALTDTQAVTLHNYFMYAKAVIARVHPRLPIAERRDLCVRTAIAISRDPELAATIHELMERRFRQGQGGDFSRSIQRTEPYDAVEALVN